MSNRIYTYLHGAIFSEVLESSCAIYLFDLIGDRAVTFSELEEKLPYDPTILRARLELLCEMGVLEREGERFRNGEEAKRFLLRSAPGFQGELLLRQNRFNLPILQKTSAAKVSARSKKIAERTREVRSKLTPSQFRKVVRGKMNDPRSREDLEQFSRWLSPHAVRSAMDLAGLFDFKSISHVHDLGGNDGSFLESLLREVRHLGGTIIDLPSVIKIARSKIASSPYKSRLKTLARNFFETPLPRGHCYTCGYIVHDWNDEFGLYILRSVWDALQPGGIVILRELVLDPPGASQEISLDLARSNYVLTCSLAKGGFAGARERTRAQYVELLEIAAFEVVQVIQGNPLTYFIARKN